MKRHCANEPLKRSLRGNAIGLNMLGIGKMQSSQSEAVLYNPVHSPTDGYSMSRGPSPGVVVHGRVFQHVLGPSVPNKNGQRKDGELLLQLEKSLEKKQRPLFEPSVVLSSDEEGPSVWSGSFFSGSSHSSSPLSSCDDYFTSNYFAITKSRLPRRKQMKDPFGKTHAIKRQKVKECHHTLLSETPSSYIAEGISVVCRCVRVGTMHRTPSEHVTFTNEYIQIDEQVQIQTSSLASCAWCSVQTLPALFLKTSQGEGQRLRMLLKMSRTDGDSWYDCKSQHLGENYIILVFEKTLSVLEKVELLNVFREMGRRNGVDAANFTKPMSFGEANKILMESFKSSPGKPLCVPDAQFSLSPKNQTKQIVFTPPQNTSSLGLPSTPERTLLSRSPTRSSSLPRCTSPVSTHVLDDEEVVEIDSPFKGPVKKLIVYPRPPARGGICVTNEDLHCLNDGEFLNDVIIDFYLKYLTLAVLTEPDASRTHVFSSFFYNCLTQTEQRKVPGSEVQPVKKTRHNRVRTWTRNVDLFQKDFIFVPINESAHWFLAVICFPGLLDPQDEPPYPNTWSPSWLEDPGSCLDRGFLVNHNSPNPMSLFFSPPGNDSMAPPSPESADLDLSIRLSVCSGGGGREQPRSGFRRRSTSVEGHDLKQQQLLSGDRIRSEIENDLRWNAKQLDHVVVSPKPTACKRPCILIMDSLGGSGRSGVLKILQEYLEVEWEVRKGTLRSFSKDIMRGINPLVPQQDNFSDCGIYLLQYVESFFQNPPQDIEPQMDLSEWFPLQRVKRKRGDIRKLVLEIQRQQEKDTKHL